MKKPSCRRTGPEREQHERAIRVRKMTDAQLCEYLDGLAGVPLVGPTREEVINEFLVELGVRGDDGLRMSDATIRKVREIAVSRGFVAGAEEDVSEA